jgi:hypothetical protein
MIDCASQITQQIGNTLYQNGIGWVGRYLSNSSWKGLTLPEVQTIKNANIQIISIYETNPTKGSYFSKDQGISDANSAYQLAKTLNQPEGTAIYFTVDYDAQVKDFANILNYFQGLKDTLTSYKIGCYGSYNVVQLIQSKGLADYYFQTVAWSSGQHAKNIHLFQYKCDIQQFGLNCDLDQVENGDCGAWGQVMQANVISPIPPYDGLAVAQKVKATKVTDIRRGASHDSPFFRNTIVGETFNVYKRLGDWHCVGNDINGEYWIDGMNGSTLYWLDNPALKAPTTKKYPIQAGQTLTKIASIFHTDVQTLLHLNPQISNPNKIYVGQIITVPNI